MTLNLSDAILLAIETESVAREPEIVVTQWSIVDVLFADGQNSHHLIGHVTGTRWRVSSDIINFNPEIEITTRSGRIYKLYGEPEMGNIILDIWEDWKAEYGVIKYRNISQEYERKIKKTIN